MFKDLLDEIKRFKYQITGKVLLRKRKVNVDIEFALVYFDSATKTVSNTGFESVYGECVNISIYSLLSRITYIKLPLRSRNSMKGLINIKNKRNK